MKAWTLASPRRAAFHHPDGIMAKANPAWSAASGLAPQALDALTWGAFVLRN